MKYSYAILCAIVLAATAVPAAAQLTLAYDDDPVTEACNWTVDKSVTPEAASLFAGDSADVQWDVEVSFDGSTFSLSGHLTATSASGPFNNETLNICVQKNAVTEGSCFPAPTWTNINGASHQYAYSFAGPYTKGADAWTVFAEVRSPSNVQITTKTLDLSAYFQSCSGNLTDDNGIDREVTEAGFDTTYVQTFACDTDEGANTNTASMGDDENSATFTLDCYDLDVSKTVTEASLTRTWSWKIGKGADQDDILLNTDTQNLDVNYDVDVDTTGHTDSAWHVAGSIAVHNPNPDIAATIVSVTDTLNSSGAVAVNCGVSFPYSLAVDATLNCTYSADPGDGSDTENEATARLQNHNYDYSGVPALGDSTNFQDPKSVAYTPNHVDECLDVDDTLWDGNEVPTVTTTTVCAVGDPPDTLPYHWTYAYTVGPYTDFCGGASFDNTASFETGDQALTADTTWTIAVSADCELDCVLGFGYWKNHSSHGHAPVRDPSWDNITPSAEDSPFFLSGQTYHDVMLTSPQGGNAYYILAHHYITAELNISTGANVPTDVQTAFDAATALFNTYTPAQVLALKGKNGKETRALFIDAKDVLEQYNSAYCVDHAGQNGCPADVSGYPMACTQGPDDDLAAGKNEPIEQSSLIPEDNAIEVETTPTEFALSHNYPNPFNPSTMISFQLPESSLVRLSVFDVQGREVARLVDGSLPAGTHAVQFSASNLPSGLYVYTLSAGGHEFRQTMVLMK